MGAAIMAILAGVCLISMVIYPMGKAPLRENQVSGWAAWREEFSFCLKFYNPLVIVYEGAMGWDNLSETLCRLLFGLFGMFIILAGTALVLLGFFLMGVA